MLRHSFVNALLLWQAQPDTEACVVLGHGVQVGTYIGERLLYAPSVGFCLLLAEALARLAGPRLLDILPLWGRSRRRGMRPRPHAACRAAGLRCMFRPATHACKTGLSLQPLMFPWQSVACCAAGRGQGGGYERRGGVGRLGTRRPGGRADGAAAGRVRAAHGGPQLGLGGRGAPVPGRLPGAQGFWV